MRFEKPMFKMTKEMCNLMGGSKNAEPYKFFVDQTIRAFLAVRKYHEHLFNMISLIEPSGLKCFRGRT